LFWHTYIFSSAIWLRIFFLFPWISFYLYEIVLHSGYGPSLHMNILPQPSLR
jgi:hypothetical protein